MGIASCFTVLTFLVLLRMASCGADCSLFSLGRDKGVLPGGSHNLYYYANISTYQNTPLEEIAKIFDGEDAHVGGSAATKSGQVILEQIEERDKTEARDI